MCGIYIISIYVWPLRERLAAIAQDPPIVLDAVLQLAQLLDQLRHLCRVHLIHSALKRQHHLIVYSKNKNNISISNKSSLVI